MFNATQARQNAEQATSLVGPYLREETEALLKLVEQKSLTGERVHYEYTSLPKIIKERLVALGFEVSVQHCQRDGTTTTISW